MSDIKAELAQAREDAALEARLCELPVRAWPRPTADRAELDSVRLMLDPLKITDPARVTVNELASSLFGMASEERERKEAAEAALAQMTLDRNEWWQRMQLVCASHEALRAERDGACRDSGLYCATLQAVRSLLGHDPDLPWDEHLVDLDLRSLIDERDALKQELAQPCANEAKRTNRLHTRPGAEGRWTVSKWQPMATAPKDGTIVDLWCETDEWEQAKFYFGHTCCGVPDQTRWQGRVQECVYRDGWRPAQGNSRLHRIEATPTHWTPLPLPPQAQQDGGQ